ncbi:MAG: S-layer homology domain-containing protein [Clostridiales bacterium]|nr:S-layer homology domain-containing protein [Clostridiales bacterium]MDU1028142.1 S-layer homology domain-containing protein [Clostridiales bacterium]
MKRKYIAFMLVLLMLAQVFTPEVVWAKSSEPSKQTTVQLVKMGALDPKTYPKLDNKAILAIQKQARTNQNRLRTGSSGFFSVGSPYLPGQNPTDNEKAAAYGNLRVDFVTEGLKDKGVLKPFQWNEIFGTDSNGNPGTANIYFVQRDAKTNKEINTFKLTVDKAGKYSLNDLYGKPAKLPLYSKALEPYKYAVELETGVSEKITLLTMELSGTGKESPSYTMDSEGKLVADIPLYLKIGQTASTKFVSKWNTNVQAADRPKVVGGFNNKTADDFNYFPFPQNNSDVLKIRREQFNIETDEWPGYMPQTPIQLREVPKVTVEEDMLEDPATYAIDKDAKRITATNGKTYRYNLQYDVINGGKLTMTEVIPVTFDANGGQFASVTDPNAEQKIESEVDYEKDATVPEAPTKEGYTFVGWGDANNTTTPVKDEAFKGIKEAKTFFAIFTQDVIEQKGENKPDNVPDGHIKVTVDVTEKANLTTDDKQTRIFWVNPNKEVTLPVTKPTGKNVSVDRTNSKAFTWNFTNWTSNEKPLRTWSEGIDAGITATFPKETVITANYDKEITDQGTVVAKEITVYESYKDGEAWVNDVIPKEDDLKAAVKVQNASGDEEALPEGAIVELVDDSGSAYADEAALKTALYEKLQEKDNPKDEPTRVEKVKAKVTFKNGEVQTVDIPIKVIKNIYEAKTLTKKPYYVPADYVMVTVNPTTKAKDPQKTYYYVNPKAQVVIPGEDPEGTGDNKFIKWTMKADSATGAGEDYALADRHKFTESSTITAQYSADVVPQKGENKPEGIPDNFVKVTFIPTDNGTMEGAKVFWVNPDKAVTIPVKNPVGKTYYTFKEWKIGDVKTGGTYKVGTPQQFTDKNGTTITATYEEAKNIIPYNPQEPITRPDGYVRVTFAADPGLKLTEQKAYYVKKNAGITLGNAELTKPGYEEQTGYKFKEWDKKDDLVIEAADIVVTAKATKLDNVIPEKKDDGTPNEKPEGYKEVTFVVKTGDEAKGSITGVAKYYVNPKEYAKINPPATEANTGYVFGSWDKDTTIPTVYDKNTTIIGSFNGLKDIIPKKNPDGTENKQPEGYKTVTFVINPAIGGKIADDEITVYYVNPAKNVTVPQPKTNADTGYKFKEWDQDTTKEKKYDKDTTVKGSFEKLKDIIPAEENGTPNAKPEGYVTLTFEKGEHGKEIKGQTVYYVNPKANPTKKLGDDLIKKPTAKADIGYKFAKWDTEDSFEIKDNKTVIAQYEELKDVIPKTKQDESEKPEGYITVTFVKGDHGQKLDGQAVYYVNPTKAVVLKDKAPTAVPKAGYQFARWDTTIDKAIQYKNDDKITALYNEPGNISKTEVEGYVKVEFKPGTNGSLEGTQAYWIKPGVEVNIPAPTVKPNVGYKFDKWDKSLTVTAKANDPTYKITAQYEGLGAVIPQKNIDGSDKPNGYVTVTFKAKNGSLEGATTYYVNGAKEVDLTNTANAITKNPNVGYTAEGGAWDKPLKAKFKDGDELTFTFKALDDVIEVVDGKTKPEGYVTVKLIPTDKATDETKAEKSYWVNPKKENVTIPSTDPVGKEITDANNNTYTFIFKDWTSTRGIHGTWAPSVKITGTFTQDTDIEAKYNVKAAKLVNGPIAKDGVVTPKGVVPEAKDLIKNIPGSENDPLPEGTTFNYKGGNPDLSEPGEKTVVVEVHYPNGKTATVEVPITVVDNVVPQTGKDKPNVPDSYVKVTVDTTDKATDNTKFVKVFWVKPNVEVTIPGIQAPTGKPETVGSVTKTNNFDKWQRQGADPAKFYDKDITDTFTENTTIVATYTVKDNVPPVGKDNPWIPQNSTPSPRDFIKNPYDDNDPNNPNNLPPGTKFEFLNGNPDTSEPGEGKTTTIKVIYPNGETKEVPVKYRVTGDVVEQTDPKKKPDVPDNFVQVIVDPTDQAKDPTKRIFWVNPEKKVTIPVSDPEGGAVKDGSGKEGNWKFTRWDASLTQVFTEDTTITAQYAKSTTDQETKPGRRSGGSSGGSGGVLVPSTPKPTPEKPSEGDLNKDDHYQYLIGYPDGTFAPNRGMTRAEVATMFTRLLKDRPVKWLHYSSGLSDIYAGDWYADTVGYAVEKGIVSGYPDGTFRPNQPITRAEFASIASRFAALTEEKDLSFSDLDASHWGYKAIRLAASNGWISGYPDNTFRPEKAISRAEVTSITNRMLNRYADLDWIDAHRNEVIRFSDVDRSDWFFEPVMEATMGHDFTRDKDGKAEHWTGLNGKTFI